MFCGSVFFDALSWHFKPVCPETKSGCLIPVRLTRQRFNIWAVRVWLWKTVSWEFYCLFPRAPNFDCVNQFRNRIWSKWTNERQLILLFMFLQPNALCTNITIPIRLYNHNDQIILNNYVGVIQLKSNFYLKLLNNI